MQFGVMRAGIRGLGELKRWKSRGGKRVERKVESPAYCECTIWKIHVSSTFGLNSSDRSRMLPGKGEP
jgi:hypothetical protein